jgi:photosystem II stability/assembly factor-like uncharacterized protein
MKRYLAVTMIGLLALLASAVGCAPMATPPPAAPTQVPVEPTAAAVPTQAPTQAAAESLWEVVRETRVEQPVRMAAFLDETFGLTGGANYEGRAHYTTDGGQTWTMAETSSGCLFAFDVVDVRTVWECNASDIRLSTDGGQTWQGSQGPRGQPFCRVSSADDKTVWYLSPSKLEATADGGTTWEEVTLPEAVYPRDVLAISLRTPQGGYILDSTGALYVTSDGGETWSSQTLGLADKYGDMEPMPPGSVAPVAIRFFDAEHGLIVLSLVGGGRSKVVALRTADGGQTWAEEVVPAEIGVPYLTHDGRFLTIHSFFNTGKITVLRYAGG